MPKTQKIIEDLNFISDRMSTQIRTIALGLLATTWGLLIGRSEVATDIADKLKVNLIIIGAIAILTMCFDFLQYLFGYLESSDLLNKMEKGTQEEGKYKRSSLFYCLRKSFFWVKQISLGIGVAWFIVSFCAYLLT